METAAKLNFTQVWLSSRRGLRGEGAGGSGAFCVLLFVCVFLACVWVFFFFFFHSEAEVFCLHKLLVKWKEIARKSRKTFSVNPCRGSRPTPERTVNCVPQQMQSCRNSGCWRGWITNVSLGHTRDRRRRKGKLMRGSGKGSRKQTPILLCVVTRLFSCLLFISYRKSVHVCLRLPR